MQKEPSRDRALLGALALLCFAWCCATDWNAMLAAPPLPCGLQEAAQSPTEKSVTEDEIRELLSSALTVFNFERGTYALEGPAGYVQLRDLGPGDQYARFEGTSDFAEGIAGQAYELGETATSMRIPHMRPEISKQRRQLTISFWHKAAEKRNTFMFCCGLPQRKCLSLVMLDDGRYEIGWGGNVLTTRDIGWSEEWQHVALVFDYTSLQLYLDGEVFDSWKLTPTILNERTIGAANTYFGAKSTFGGNRGELLYRGLIDEIAILPGAATQEQVGALYNWTKAGNVFPELDNDPKLVTGVAHAEPRDLPTVVDFEQDFTLQEDARYPAVAKILDSALAVYNFEQGTYARHPSRRVLLVQDLGPDDNFGQCDGGYVFQNGIAGQGLVFDGAQRSLGLPTLHSKLINDREAFTISFWHKPDAEKNGVIFDCGLFPQESLALSLRVDNRYQLYCGKNAIVTSTVSHWNEGWQHVAFVFDKSLAALYIDGRLRETWVITPRKLNKSVVGGSSARIGAQVKESPDRADRFYQGIMDEIAILPRAATEEEIKLLHEWSRDGLPLPRTADDPELVPFKPHGVPAEIPLARPVGAPKD